MELPLASLNTSIGYEIQNQSTSRHLELQIRSRGWLSDREEHFSLVPQDLGLDPTPHSIQEGDELLVYVNGERKFRIGTSKILKTCPGALRINLLFKEVHGALIFDKTVPDYQYRKREDFPAMCTVTYRLENADSLGGASTVLLAQEILNGEAIQRIPICIPIPSAFSGNAPEVQLPRKQYRLLNKTLKGQVLEVGQLERSQLGRAAAVILLREAGEQMTLKGVEVPMPTVRQRVGDLVSRLKTIVS